MLYDTSMQALCSRPVHRLHQVWQTTTGSFGRLDSHMGFVPKLATRNQDFRLILVKSVNTHTHFYVQQSAGSQACVICFWNFTCNPNYAYLKSQITVANAVAMMRCDQVSATKSHAPSFECSSCWPQESGSWGTDQDCKISMTDKTFVPSLCLQTYSPIPLSLSHDVRTMLVVQHVLQQIRLPNRY